ADAHAQIIGVEEAFFAATGRPANGANKVALAIVLVLWACQSAINIGLEDLDERDLGRHDASRAGENSLVDHVCIYGWDSAARQRAEACGILGGQVHTADREADERVFDYAKDQREEDRGDQGELQQSLAARPPSRSARTRLDCACRLDCTLHDILHAPPPLAGHRLGVT